ncbi:hypothetical protein XI25_07455 [Paenibacillus sp. DMB20]|nr:hypothetical protein XI25_07455 [Paenibacillus sp. DMB20]
MVKMTLSGTQDHVFMYDLANDHQRIEALKLPRTGGEPDISSLLCRILSPVVCQFLKTSVETGFYTICSQLTQQDS